ncbi:MAG: MmpS family transport accessory protein [Mycobacterium sp.]
MLGVLVACSLTAAGVADAQPELAKVRYEVSGNSSVADYLSYQTDTGQQHQANVKLPWSTQFNAFAPSEVFVISAQGPGPITCRILVNGNVVNQATANGQPARTVCTH